jgi:CheY-like chemotaxis protein/anti-sigma regulatory factor (Ser/Thr protein kinase)
MSHELRTPLNGVIGYAQVLQDDRRLLSDQRERLRIVQNSGEHLLRMINDVLDLAKIEAGKLELRPAPFALADLVRDIVAAHAPTAASKRLTFSTDLAPDLPPWVEGDAQKLRQILDNLLGNAVKFTAKGSVTLRVSVSQLSALNSQLLIAFAITDTGPGIDTHDQARLFQPFEQATRSRPNAPGAGLGLAISRALVDRLGGSLTLTSEPGRGSTFSFSVPLPAVAPDPVLVARTRRLSGYEGPRRHVLIVDDNQVNRSLLADLLIPLGFSCVEFPSGEAALAHLARSDSPLPDLAILDVRMQDLDGLELTRRLRALPRGASLKILLTSASVLTFDPAAGRAAGCDDFLPKPFRTADLVEKITALLALTWRSADSASPFASVAADSTPLPPALRDQLRELLAQGDLDAFRSALSAARPLHPACEPHFAALEAAAAAFELSRLRLLLDQP